MTYKVVGRDEEGYDVAGGVEFDRLADAKASARNLVRETEAIAAGCVHAFVFNGGECIADYFSKNYLR
jgi:hypothetical protein